MTDLSRCCEKCWHWLGSRNREWNAKYPDTTAMCRRHQPAEFHWYDTCSYFEEAGGKA